jgi:FtsZ-binding cell division protein ZapB
MGAIEILDLVKGKVLDAANFEKLKSAYELQENNIEQLKTNNDALKESNGLLREKNQKLVAQIEQLNKINKDYQDRLAKFDTSQTLELSEEAQKILIFLTNNEDVTADQIAHNISIDLTRVKYWLGELSVKDMVYDSFAFNSPTEYGIKHNGREYLIKQNLI